MKAESEEKEATQVANVGIEERSAVSDGSQEEVAPEEPTINLEPGWIVKVFQATENTTDIPKDALGAFVYSEDVITPIAHRDDKGLAFNKSQSSYLFEGWFKAEKAGRYSFIADLKLPSILVRSNKLGMKCSYWLEIEDNKVLQDDEILRSADTEEYTYKNLVNGVELEPGLYKTRQWLSCYSGVREDKYLCGGVGDFPEELKRRFDCEKGQYTPSEHVELTLRVKKPGAISPTPIASDSIYHKVG